MLLRDAAEADYAEIVELANVAYRKTGPGSSWSSEEDLVIGHRISESLLREDFVKNPKAHLLVYRESPDAPLQGTVWVEPKDSITWYLGLLTVRPDMQNKQVGRTILSAAEEFVRERGGQRVRMTVLSVRTTLIAWYTRRGYALIGETQPWQYGDDRFGIPLRDDLMFVVMQKDL
jgi:GNAT superfamily N-acetyltransferase